MLPRLILAGFLLAHGAIHAGFLSRRPPAPAGGPPWPFELGRSSILAPLGVAPELARILGMAHVADTIGGLALVAIAALGLLPAVVWPPATAVGAIASVALLLLFFHRSLVLGLAIDVGLLWAVLVAGWTPEASALP